MPHMANLPWIFYYLSIPLVIMHLKMYIFFYKPHMSATKKSLYSFVMTWKW